MIIELKDSQMSKIKDLEKYITELERSLGQKQINIDFLKKMIDLAKEEYNIYNMRTNTSKLKNEGIYILSGLAGLHKIKTFLTTLKYIEDN